MKNLINILIICLIIFISYNYLCYDIEYFSNDANQYLEQLYNKISDSNFDNLSIINDVTINGEMSIKNGINGDLVIDNNLIADGNIKAKIGYINRAIVNDKYTIYKKSNAMSIGKINNSNVIPSLYLNPGSKENLWVFENINNDNFWFYAWNAKGPNFGHYTSNEFNMDNILNDNSFSFIGIDDFQKN